MQAVKDNAHAFGGGDQGGCTDNQTDSSECTVASTDIAECEKKFDDDTNDDETDAETAGEDNAGSVAVANGPPNEVWMELVAEDGFDISNNASKGGGMGGLFECFEESFALTGGDVELAGG